MCAGGRRPRRGAAAAGVAVPRVVFVATDEHKVLDEFKAAVCLTTMHSTREIHIRRQLFVFAGNAGRGKLRSPDLKILVSLLALPGENVISGT